MRPIVLALSLLLVAALAPASAAASERCAVSVSPAVVSPTDAVDIVITGVPVAPNGGSVEIGIDVRRLSTHEGTAYFLFAWPGVTELSLKHNFDYSGENPLPPMEPGRYLVRVTTPHLHGGCNAVGLFRVVAD
ncbi:MAG TPA: hypothetical protein VFY23_02565 [Candidatus Limnocylindrales bacterium]|nr:hypothetical protein [Candidatus Limnocylindrales bacterium]